MKLGRHIARLLLGVLLGLWPACWALGAEEIELGPRYVDPVHGFSLRPPTGTERKRETALSRRVNWSQLDPKTGATAWSLIVLQGKESKTVSDLGPYAKALAQKLRSQEQFQVESTELASIAGKAAIELTGLAGGNVHLWQRQVWVLADPDRFLIFTIYGSIDLKDQMSKVLKAVLGTLELTDVKAAKAALEANLKRGQKLLSGLTKDKLAQAVCPEPQWQLLQLQGKYVGFMRLKESMTTHQGDEGCAVKSCVLVRPPEAAQRLLKRVLFATPDRRIERWSEQLRIGTGSTAARSVEDGIKQQELILCQVTQGRKVQTHRRQVPTQFYLPRAMQMLLPRLVDLSAPATYAFITYATAANSFETRSFTVVGPEQITVDSRRVRATRATEQPAVDAPQATLWLDEKGRLLRMETADGVVMESATHAAVLRRFPEADKILQSLGE